MSTQELRIQRVREDANRRWWVLAGILSLVIFLNSDQKTMEYWPALGVLACGVLYNFLLTLLVHRQHFSYFWKNIERATDLLLAGGLIFFTGGLAGSPLFFLLPLLVLIQTFSPGKWNVVYSGLGAIACEGILFYLGPPRGFSLIFLEQALVLASVTGVSYLLAKKHQRETMDKTAILLRQEQQLEAARRNEQDLELKIKVSTQQVEKANVLLVKKNLALMSFHEIYAAMSSTTNTAKLLSLLMDTAMSLLKANSGVLMLRVPNTEFLRVKVSRGLPANLVRNLQIKIKDQIEGQVAHSGQAQLLADLDRLPRVAGIMRDCRSKMCVPLWSRKKIVGVISVESSTPGGFNQNDLELFNTLGSQASEVLQSLEMYEELRTKADHLSLLFEVGKSIGTIFNLRILFETILEHSLQFMKARRGFLLIYDKGENDLKIRASLGLHAAGDLHPVAIDQGIAGWVFKKAKPVLIPDVEKSPYYDPEQDRMFKGHDLLACPLNIRQKIFGVICLCGRIGAKHFTPEDLDLLSALAAQAAIAIENVELYASIRRDYLNAIKALAAAVDAKDHYTHGHSHKVMVYAATIARALGQSEKEIEKIKYGALLHDVGKIGISEAVLNKPTKLTPKEFDTIAMHPILGVSIVQNIETLKDLIPAILCHHERYSGGGYPEGRSGEDIPLCARIVAVADAWDVMTSDRAYRKALPRSVAVSELKKGAGTQFDPHVVEAFLAAQEQETNAEPVKEYQPSDSFWDEEEIARLLD